MTECRPAGLPDNAWPNCHTMYIAQSGMGKSQALLQNWEIPKRGARVILWDHKPDHPGVHCRTRRQFLRALRKGIKHHQKTGRGFRVAYSGERTPEAWEWFCRVVWSVLDARVQTYVLVEELAAVGDGVAKASPMAGILMREGRGYGLAFHATTQRPQEVAKTYYENCERRYYGRTRNAKLRKAWAEEMDISPDRLRELAPLQFLYDDGAGQPTEVRLKYKAPAGIRWLE